MVLPPSDNADQCILIDSVVVRAAKRRHAPVHLPQTVPTIPSVQPSSSSTAYIAPHAPIHLLPPNFGWPPSLLPLNLYALPPTDLSYHPPMLRILKFIQHLRLVNLQFIPTLPCKLPQLVEMVLEGRHKFSFLTRNTSSSTERPTKTILEGIGFSSSIHIDQQYETPYWQAITLCYNSQRYSGHDPDTLYSKRQNVSCLYTLRKQVHECK
ncbi:kirola-like [Cucumis melo var. makuwa]|uniref:Kirola-like n=1 Tax=Cucumis melo var. makuwa TaxID=1194695 RepID=A0A5D3DUL0_CUCMM|nr:kirola-like [Cucumis melo var. makuwa]